MSSSQSAFTNDQPEFLYSVFNLPTSASQNEIRERYRALSVIFHPDKQHDEQTKETAAKRFLEIQRAYEVLSDPVLRAIYDVLGEEGLTQKWSPELRSLPPDELRAQLKNAKRDQRREELEGLINPRGRITCGINAISLFSPDNRLAVDGSRWHERLLERFQNVRMSTFGLRHSVEREINEKTSVSLSARVARDFLRSRSPNAGFSGTIRHQYSPRLAFQGTLDIFNPHVLSLKSTYRDGENTVVIQGDLSQAALRHLPPPVTISLSRRLYRDSLTEGILTFHTGPQPFVAINVISPTPFDLTSDSSASGATRRRSQKLGSLSGFGTGAQYSSYTVLVAGLATSLKAEWGVTFTELALRLKVGIDMGLLGLSWLLTGTWAPSDNSEVSASVGLNSQGVIMKLEALVIQQRISVPITLSQDSDARLALCTAVLPTAMFVLGYHFVLKPQRRAKRAAHFRSARRALDEERLNAPREAEETIMLLKETAKRHMQTENATGGLVILEASYGPKEPDQDVAGLIVDVTVPLQALVHGSQLHIPGHRQKSGIQGFYDPAPDFPKTLCIRYLFRGRTHYTEIPDHIPVVLPLEGHLVDNP